MKFERLILAVCLAFPVSVFGRNADVPGGAHLSAYLTYASEIFDFLETH